MGKTYAKSIVCTFCNHPPIRLHGEFESENDGKFVHQYEDGRLWDGNQDFGHHEINYYICKSGKLLYWASYNSGYSYGGHDPETKRTFLRDKEAIEEYFSQHGIIEEWYRVMGRVDPDSIVDSDLL